MFHCVSRVVVVVLAGVLDSLEQMLNSAEHFLLSVLGWDVQAVAQQLSNVYSFWVFVAVPFSLQGQNYYCYYIHVYPSFPWYAEIEDL